MTPRLWLVTDRRLVPDVTAAARRALAVLPPTGCAIVLREKDLPTRDLMALATALRRLTRDRGARLVVSGRLDIALASDADAVHLGFEAPPAAAVRRVVGQALNVGVSLHGEEQAPAEADYAFLSPVFATTSKPGATPLGLGGLRRGVSRSSIPVVALGGIDASRIAACLTAGVAGVALRSGWLDVDDSALEAIGRALGEAFAQAPVAAAVTRH